MIPKNSVHSSEISTITTSPLWALGLVSPGPRLLLCKSSISACLASSLCLLPDVGPRKGRRQASGLKLLLLSVLSSMDILWGQGYR